MTTAKVVIVDYGLGNLFSLQRAFEALGVPATISDRPAEVAAADRLVLPGVGAFAEGMAGLRERQLLEPVLRHAQAGRPLLGVCLGMQLLMVESEEHGRHAGLSLLPGRVTLLSNGEGEERVKVPHIGWNELAPPRGRDWKGSLLRDLPERPFIYFVHSFAVPASDAPYALATTAYGPNLSCSVVEQGNIVGVQGHPELSGETGLAILKNFVSA
jgi:glutamine amidotransferase